MSNLFDDKSIDISCPECGVKHPKTLGWIKANDYLDCGCGVRITLEKSSIVDGIEKLEQSIADLRREVRNLSR